MSNSSILLIEDNADDELLTLEALAANQISQDITVVRNGAEALDYLFCRGQYDSRNINDAPKLVLLDLNLPKIGGLEVLRQIRSNPKTRCQPVVVLTSSNEDEDRLRSYQMGANSYVRKPVDFAEFLTAAGQLGLYWLNVNQSPPEQTV